MLELMGSTAIGAMLSRVGPQWGLHYVVGVEMSIPDCFDEDSFEVFNIGEIPICICLEVSAFTTQNICDMNVINYILIGSKTGIKW